MNDFVLLNDKDHPIYYIIIRRILLSDTWWGICPICKKERFIFIGDVSYREGLEDEFWGCVTCPYEVVYKDIDSIYPYTSYNTIQLEAQIKVRMFPKDMFTKELK